MEQVKLLMTELSPELTRLCAETLAAQDIAVTVCEKDGAKALAALSAEKPDAVLLDAFMPGLDALTVKQRYDEAGGGKTVFFVTGSFTDDALESEMMKKGFSFYFQKPFDPEVLAARARTAAGRHAQGTAISFNAFKAIPASGSVIDHVLIDPAIRVRRWHLLAEHFDGRVASDHFPVIADLSFSSGGNASNPALAACQGGD